MTDLILDADHVYWAQKDGTARELIGCTNALKAVGLINVQFYNDEAMLRGTAVHRGLEWFLNGEKSGPKVPKPLSGYVRAGLKYLDDSKAEVLNVEMSMMDEARQIAGTPDLIAQVIPPASPIEPCETCHGNGKCLGLACESCNGSGRGEPRRRYAIIDWKTGQPERWHGYQLAWYEHLARVNGLVEGLVDRTIVHLKADGTYTTRTHRDRNDWKVADAARLIEQAKRAA